jgi:hypothetical protein
MKTSGFVNDDNGLLHIYGNFPTSTDGLYQGEVYRDGNILKVVT